MKTHFKLTLIIIFGLLFNSCKSQSDLINDEFAKEKQEVLETFEAFTQSIKAGDIDLLISFYSYSPKFTEFKNGQQRNNSAENEADQRNNFNSVTKIIKFEAKRVQIAVYGKVANLTFYSDYHFKLGKDLVVINDQITLLLVKANNEWKIVHEHHSPLKTENWCLVLHEHDSIASN